MYITSAKDLQRAARQVHLRLEDMTRIKESRKWWEIPFTKESDLPASLRELHSEFEQTVDKEIVKRASEEGLKIVPDGLSVLWIEDFVFTTNTNFAALIRISPPKATASILQSLLTNDTWKNSLFTRLLTSQVEQTEAVVGDIAPSSLSETSKTGVPFDVETLRQQLRLVARTRDKIKDGNDVTFNEGDVLVLERENGLEVKEGGIAVMLRRYRVEQKS